jgi:hypothetical protein
MNIRITRMTTKCHCNDPKTSGDLSQIGCEVRKANRNRQENGFVSTIKMWTGSKDLGDNRGFGGCKVDTEQGEVGSEVPCRYPYLLACSAVEESEAIGCGWDEISDEEAGYQRQLVKALPADLAAPYLQTAAIAVRNMVLHVRPLAGR